MEWKVMKEERNKRQNKTNKQKNEIDFDQIRRQCQPPCPPFISPLATTTTSSAVGLELVNIFNVVVPKKKKKKSTND